MSEANNDPAGDRPIIVGGGPLHISVQLPRTSRSTGPKKYSLAPKDPVIPFKEVVITKGGKEVMCWPLPEEWEITIR